MERKVLGKCPVCDEKLQVTQLQCPHCKIKIEGEFTMSKFDYLTPEQQTFALVFLKNAGNIKSIENELNISYPTVKKCLDEVICGLGFQEVINNRASKLTRKEILSMIAKDEISLEEAEKLIKDSEGK